MKKFILLYRTLRKCDVLTSSGTSPYADKSIPVSLLVELVFILASIAGCGYVGYACAGIFDLFGGINVVLSVLALAAGFVVAVKGLVQLVNSLYMSTDTTLLITMPLSAVLLAMVRTANVLYSSFLITAGMLLSFSTGYSLAASTGFSFWIGVFSYLVLIPLFATSAAAALVLLFMSVFRIFRSRSVVKYIGVFGALIGVIAYVFWYILSSLDIDLVKAAGSRVKIIEAGCYVGVHHTADFLTVSASVFLRKPHHSKPKFRHLFQINRHVHTLLSGDMQLRAGPSPDSPAPS